MKKKKLKKKIKKLEKEVERYRNNLSIITQTDISLSNKIRNLKDKIEKLENDNKYYKEWMDRSGVDYKSWFKTDSRSCTDCKYYRMTGENGPIPCYGCTSTDKKMFEPKGEKTCDTCKWKPLMEQGGQDIPCMGCTADDKKMWKSKGEE